ncbi:MAG: type II secretion system major pseudopilin GspG [Pseudomonadota bacterium]
MREKRRRDRGMTLIEIMVVLAIIGLIGGMTTVYVAKQMAKSKINVAKTEMKNMESALELYRIENGNFPSTEEGLQKLVEGGYLKKVPKDPWKNPYVYYSPGLQGNEYEIYSYGSDRKEGGMKDNADISSFDEDKEQEQQ